jgi:7,8-dihydropterin-6-yl-methyl-4-(beta-D-ribofuranosyl)aminobenzene 5'-phosphate synthase
VGLSQTTNRVTILYDAFGKPGAAKLTQDWGYSALVEYGGKQILFDTGNNPEIFSNNAKGSAVNLGRKFHRHFLKAADRDSEEHDLRTFA